MSAVTTPFLSASDDSEMDLTINEASEKLRGILKKHQEKYRKVFDIGTAFIAISIVSAFLWTCGGLLRGIQSSVDWPHNWQVVWGTIAFVSSLIGIALLSSVPVDKYDVDKWAGGPDESCGKFCGKRCKSERCKSFYVIYGIVVVICVVGGVLFAIAIKPFIVGTISAIFGVLLGARVLLSKPEDDEVAPDGPLDASTSKRPSPLYALFVKYFFHSQPYVTTAFSWAWVFALALCACYYSYRPVLIVIYSVGCVIAAARLAADGWRQGVAGNKDDAGQRTRALYDTLHLALLTIGLSSSYSTWPFGKNNVPSTFINDALFCSLFCLIVVVYAALLLPCTRIRLFKAMFWLDLKVFRGALGLWSSFDSNISHFIEDV